MDDLAARFADVVLVIKSDKKLRECFIHALKFGASTQQVRVSLLRKELDKLQAPREVMEFIGLLANDKLAHAVLHELES